MTRKALLTASVSGFVLMGCAYPWPGVTTEQSCTGQHCEVVVTATQHDTPGFSCFVEKSVPGVLTVKHPRPVIVDWNLDTKTAKNGYKFPDQPGYQAIVFDDPTGWDCHLQTDGKQIKCRNNAAPGWHKYTVYVSKGSTRCDPLDPYVVNQ